ncbi:zinc ribbon domain-containing protein [Tetragenococcus koreensis]|uniref:zinc ribbon domain-containing protein n=1 Tax=Tetragenococcus koreensis TaxID=290335 RepID=UPI0022AACEF7|nr:zinc ribbon domain-containing protein [Tetragenococcus koreensis]
MVKVDKWFPSSQICSDCGHQDRKKPLRVKMYTCKYALFQRSSYFKRQEPLGLAKWRVVHRKPQLN